MFTRNYKCSFPLCSIFKRFYLYLYVCTLPSMPEEGAGTPGTRATDWWTAMWVLGTQTGCSARTQELLTEAAPAARVCALIDKVWGVSDWH